MEHPYEIEVVRVDQQGYKFCKVWGIAKSVDKAIVRAMQDAVASSLFSGISGNSNAASVPAICGSVDTYHKNKEFFDKFFESGEFLHYVRNVNSQYPSGENNIQYKGKRKVAIYVQIMYDKLREMMEEKGIVKGLSEVSQEAMKPTIMVVPEKSWCLKHGYVKSNNPSEVDYGKALLNDDVLNVITNMGGIMEKRGFPLKLLTNTLDEVKNEEALDYALQSKNDGEIIEDDLDKLLRVAQADIVVNVAFERVTYGPRNMIEFRITSVDAATSKQIGGEVGRSSASGAPMSVLVEEAVLSFIDNFTASIQRYFQRTIEQGREGVFVFKIAADSPLNFESTVSLNGEEGELCDAIDYWMSENTIKGAYTLASKSRVRLVFEQTRFPLSGKRKFGGSARALNAESFIKQIDAFLSQFGLNISVTPIGIGKAYIVIGGR